MSTLYEQIYKIVARIPKGKVATYGQIAAMAGIGRQARRVGYALAAVPDHVHIPWQRVINSKGEVSPRALPQYEEVQRKLLIKEGVRFGKDGRISLERYQWLPKGLRGAL